jgi:hypothetical protein
MLQLLELPQLGDTPIVEVSGTGEDGLAILIEDAPDHFTVFDGKRRSTHGKRAAPNPGEASDEPPPPTFRRVSEPQIEEPQVESWSGSRHSRHDDPWRVLAIASVLQRKGARHTVDVLLRRLAHDPPELRALVSELVAERRITEACHAYATGATHDEYERLLSRVLEPEGTRAARDAKELLAWSRAPRDPSPPPTSALEALVERRIAALADERCREEGSRSSWLFHPGDNSQLPGSVADLVALGHTAQAALERVKDDRHPSRCISGDYLAVAAYLGSVGWLAREALSEIGTRVDATDVECSWSIGQDREAVGLVPAALARRDLPAAFAILKSARGRLRVKMLDALAASKDARITAFLIEEASSAPVLAARVRAAEALRARGDARWSRLAATAIDAALRAERTYGERCDRDLTLAHWQAVWDADPASAIEPIAAGFESYGPGTKLDAGREVLSAVLQRSFNTSCAAKRPPPRPGSSR